MLNYIHRLVVVFVCVLFGAEQIVYSGFMKAFLLKNCLLRLETRLMRAVSKVAGRKTQNKSWKMLSCSVELKRSAEVDENSQCDDAIHTLTYCSYKN